MTGHMGKGSRSQYGVNRQERSGLHAWLMARTGDKPFGVRAKAMAALYVLALGASLLLYFTYFAKAL